WQMPQDCANTWRPSICFSSSCCAWAALAASANRSVNTGGRRDDIGRAQFSRVRLLELGSSSSSSICAPCGQNLLLGLARRVLRWFGEEKQDETSPDGNPAGPVGRVLGVRPAAAGVRRSSPQGPRG